MLIFFIKCIFFVPILKNTIENEKSYFLAKLCEIREKCQHTKLFTKKKFYYKKNYKKYYFFVSFKSF